MTAHPLTRRAVGPWARGDGGPAVVALGGGHGLQTSLGALRTLTERLTAVVTVADDGGSSGRLRRDLPALLPPGDLRMALCALASDDDAGRRWVRVLQHRFGGDGELAEHAAGNLLLAGLLDALGDPVEALDVVAGLLHAVGRVLPASTVPLEIEAQASGGAVRGQVAVAEAGAVAPLSGLRLVPADPPACRQAVEALLAADVVVLGPGSLYTSVLTHLLVPGIRAALLATPARLVHVLNLETSTGAVDDESAHLPLAAHVTLLTELLGRGPDVVVADARSVLAAGERAVRGAVQAVGARIDLADLASDRPGVHDTAALAGVLAGLLAEASPPPVAGGVPPRARSTAD